MHEKMIYSKPFLPIKEVKNEENEGAGAGRRREVVVTGDIGNLAS